MKLPELDKELSKYETAFIDFCSQYELPIHWFKVPDHFAIKCADAVDYLETCAELSGAANKDGIWEIRMDERLLASAELVSRVSLASYDFSWIEIMQPRPGKELNEGFVEHTEFVYPDFFEIESGLRRRGVNFEKQDNPGHSWINVEIDDMPREIKFNDKPLAEVVVIERQQGKLHRISGT